MSGDKLILPLAAIRPDDVTLAGGKGCALACLAREGIAIPFTLVVTTEAYRHFIAANGLQDKILLELNRKAFEDMRWEELWDAALRIRSMFLTHPLPAELDRQLQQTLAAPFAERAAVVRSSAPQEDSAGASFAGIHESYVNVRGRDHIIDHIRRVWASLWSDGALLYRQELGLAPEASAMAVLVQELIVGSYSGVAFTVSPVNTHQSVVEAVPGLNQGLVDGLVTPERWILNRESGAVVAHTASDGTVGVFPGEQGVHMASLEAREAARETLSPDSIVSVADLARKIEGIFGRPQDVEWTMRGSEITVLQARPVTTTTAGQDDRRGWYLSLRRSYENLQALRVRIEEELIPAMMDEADELAAMDLAVLTDDALAAEVRRRIARNQHWSNVYWEDFIPYAHGARLFGQVYNDTIKPENPYEFVDLLTDTPMASMARNRHLETLAEAVRASPETAEDLRGGRWEHLPASLRSSLETFVQQYGTLSSGLTGDHAGELADSTLVKLILALAEHPARERARQPADPSVLARRFFDAFGDAQRDWARSLLDLGRSSYRLRDDDNIHLGRIEAQVHRAVREAASRLKKGRSSQTAAALQEAVDLLPQEASAPTASGAAAPAAGPLRARQLVGQPAGPGVARGQARVVANPADLAAFRAGDILVCDAVDPNMTFVVPLAAAVVERRGGMLIHGAIIAREYGLPCVTGVPEALQYIRTGDRLTVDGYLGIVIIGGADGRED
jgi:pyruvate,water dikinase